MDRFFAILALLVLIGFLAIIAIFVPDLDLIIVFTFVAVLAICDFWQVIVTKQNKQ